MVRRLTLLLLLLAAPLLAEDLVPRVLSVEWVGSGSDSTFLTEVLRATLAQEAGFLVADAGDSADAHLVLKAQGKSQVVATLTDPHDPAHDWVKTLDVKAFSAQALKAAGESLRPAVAASLPPVPPQVREELVNKTVQEVKVNEKQKGVKVVLLGVPGTVVAFSVGPPLTIPASGALVLEDQVQYSSLAFRATLPGYFERNEELALGDQDLESDVTLKPIPQWAVAASLGSSLHFDVSRRLGTGPWFVLGDLESSWPLSNLTSTVTASETNPLNLPLGELTKVHWVQLGAGLVWYGSRPQDGFLWGFDGEALVRADFYSSGVELSRWFPAALRVGAIGGLRLTPWVSLGLRLEVGAYLTPQDVSVLDTFRNDGYRPDVEVTGYRYQDSVTGDLLRLPGIDLRNSGGLELRFWF